MPTFSQTSSEQLATCHKDLQILFDEVVKYFDCKVTEGFRDEAEQNRAYAEGKSEKKWPNGNHNKNPSLAVDVYPYPVDMNDIKRFYYFSGFVKGIAAQLKAEGKMAYEIRWGGDWNNDNQIKDNHFNDLVHFELIK
jgi:peptidoglycan L-alanyl-D-glutamate endopeptidase CwlK